jgi:hypothetical protein
VVHLATLPTWERLWMLNLQDNTDIFFPFLFCKQGFIMEPRLASNS